MDDTTVDTGSSTLPGSNGTGLVSFLEQAYIARQNAISATASKPATQTKATPKINSMVWIVVGIMFVLVVVVVLMRR